MSINFDLAQLAIGTLFGFTLVVVSYRFHFLTLSGSIATFILAVLVFGFGGLAWTIPILVFFFISSILSKTGKTKKQKFKNTFEKTGIRDYTQVIANGGLAGLFLLGWIFFPHPVFFHLYLVALASATADTWATEIGVLSKSKPILITSFKKVEPGVSGGVTLYGTLASFSGSLTIALSGYIFSRDLTATMLITIAGFLGSLMDSLLGATIQGQYKCSQCNSYTEKKIHCGSNTIISKGLNWFNNDLVNIFSAIGASIIFFILFQI